MRGGKEVRGLEWPEKIRYLFSTGILHVRDNSSGRLKFLMIVHRLHDFIEHFICCGDAGNYRPDGLG